MRILFLTLLDFSTLEESSIYTDLMSEFINNKHEVCIISPTEKRKQEYTRLIDNGNHKILKLKVGNMQKTNILEKGISTLTIESRFKNAIKKYFSDIEFDLVIYSTPPITLQKAVDFVKKRDGAKSYLLLKDIFPQNAVDLGMLKKTGLKGIIYKYFREKEKQLYKSSDYIGCMSQANVNFVLKENPEIEKNTIEICPNSIRTEPIENNKLQCDEIKIKYGMPIRSTIFLYGGNLGKPQGIDFIIECIKSIESMEDVYFVIVGSGTEFKKLKNFFGENNPKRSMLLNHLPKKDYECLANICDVGLIFLDNRFTIPNFPSRMLSYMQASIPVLASTDSNTDIGKIIESGEFGYWCRSGDVETFNKQVKLLCDLSLRKKMGANARTFLEENYTVRHSYEIIMKHFNK